MRFYSHLSEDERDQIGVLRAAVRSTGGHCPGARSGESRHLQGSSSGTHSPRADIRRFTPPEPINCAGGVKRSSNERPLYVCLWGILDSGAKRNALKRSGFERLFQARQ